MTPLHWAAKRGFYKLTNLLLNSNSDIDAEDMVIKISLFLQIQKYENFNLSKYFSK